MTESIILKDMPRYECLLELSKKFPQLEPASAYAYFTMLRATDCIDAVFADHFSQHGMSEGRFLTLITLMFDKETGESLPKSSAEIADSLQVTRATVTGLVDSLERDHYVKREPDPNDRRSTLIQLTEEGKTFMENMLPDHFSNITHTMHELSPDELNTFTALLEKIIGSTQSLNLPKS